MGVTFELRAPPTILFGSGTRRRAAPLAAPFGRRAFLVTGGRSLATCGELKQLQAAFSDLGMTSLVYAVSGEPDIATVDDGVARCADASCDVVVGVGGGSVLDVAKAVAALVPNGGSAADYLSDLPSGGGRSIQRPPLPLIAVPTTAGSGSEATRNAVVRLPDAGLKRSIRSELMVPRVAIVDPDLSGAAPRSVAVPAALDALTHLVEAYVSRGAQPTTDLLALSGLRLSFAALTRVAATEATTDPLASEQLALASLWGGIVLANAGLGAVHGLVAPLGGRFPIPHGCGCAALLAATVRTNVQALTDRDPNGPGLERYRQIADAIVEPGARATEVAAAVASLCTSLGTRPLAHYGVTEAAIGDLVEGGRGGSMKSNPIVLTDRELESILLESLGDCGAAGF